MTTVCGFSWHYVMRHLPAAWLIVFSRSFCSTMSISSKKFSKDAVYRHDNCIITYVPATHTHTHRHTKMGYCFFFSGGKKKLQKKALHFCTAYTNREERKKRSNEIADVPSFFVASVSTIPHLEAKLAKTHTFNTCVCGTPTHPTEFFFKPPSTILHHRWASTNAMCVFHFRSILTEREEKIMKNKWNRYFFERGIYNNCFEFLCKGDDTVWTGGIVWLGGGGFLGTNHHRVAWCCDEDGIRIEISISVFL